MPLCTLTGASLDLPVIQWCVAVLRFPAAGYSSNRVATVHGAGMTRVTAGPHSSSPPTRLRLQLFHGESRRHLQLRLWLARRDNERLLHGYDHIQIGAASLWPPLPPALERDARADSVRPAVATSGHMCLDTPSAIGPLPNYMHPPAVSPADGCAHWEQDHQAPRLCPPPTHGVARRSPTMTSTKQLRLYSLFSLFIWLENALEIILKSLETLANSGFSSLEMAFRLYKVGGHRFIKLFKAAKDKCVVLLMQGANGTQIIVAGNSNGTDPSLD
ncbi:hypothetical protein GGX14DRAFT_402094 [Mycena pura]|uniref:Uncharacterized protein n=1 Tax=Mycena pura TaxID=153505 RepID=A0AAD6Y5Q9_9AGAR|nr:hypothetical protein GGX14DRAFT_402094 [Mycena pura]